MLHSNSIASWQFLEQISDDQLRKKNCAPWSQSEDLGVNISNRTILQPILLNKLKEATFKY
jgi:hypothetical protein